MTLYSLPSLANVQQHSFHVDVSLKGTSLGLIRPTWEPMMTPLLLVWNQALDGVAG